MSADATTQLSIVVPCFNEEASLKEAYRRLASVCGELSHEVIFVNDGSTDQTWRTIQDLCQRDRNVTGLDLSRNHGHQLALTAGLSICRGERILIIDADLQDPPELLPEMMRLMDEGADVVYGQRKSREGETWFKLASAHVFYRLLRRLTEIDIPPDTGDFRLISRRAVDVLLAMPEQHRFIRGMVSWLGFKQSALTYERQARFAGESKYPFRKMLRFASDAITGFSVGPLRLATFFGVLMGAAALLLTVYVFGGWLLGKTVQGWTSLMIVVLLTGGVQLFVLGIIGEYLGRVFMELKRRPLFVIREIYTCGGVAAQPATVAGEMPLPERAKAERLVPTTTY